MNVSASKSTPTGLGSLSKARSHSSLQLRHGGQIHFAAHRHDRGFARPDTLRRALEWAGHESSPDLVGEWSRGSYGLCPHFSRPRCGPTVSRGASAPAMTPTWSGRRVLVTGTSSGIGATTAPRARGGGCSGRDVRTPHRPARRGARRLPAIGSCVPGVDDRPDRARHARPVHRDVESELGGIDVLVEQRGWRARETAARSTPWSDVEYIADDSTTSHRARLTLAVLPTMLARGTGQVLTVSSIAARSSTPGEAAYAAAKSAVSAYMEALAAELWGQRRDVPPRVPRAHRPHARCRRRRRDRRDEHGCRSNTGAGAGPPRCGGNSRTAISSSTCPTRSEPSPLIAPVTSARRSSHGRPVPNRAICTDRDPRRARINPDPLKVTFRYRRTYAAESASCHSRPGGRGSTDLRISAGDTAWVCASAALVMFMTPGLALFYGGMVRAKNILTMLMQNFFCLGFVSVLWAVVVYSLAFGGTGALDRELRVCVARPLQHRARRPRAVDPTVALHGVPNDVRGDPPALITGAIADRMRFGAWSGSSACGSCSCTRRSRTGCSHLGWLARHRRARLRGRHRRAHRRGYRRPGRSSRDRTAQGLAAAPPMPPHSLPLTMIGTGILWFGWFGFNAGFRARRQRPRSAHAREHATRRRGRDAGLAIDRTHARRPRDDARSGLRHGSGAGCDHAVRRLRRGNVPNRNRVSDGGSSATAQ